MDSGRCSVVGNAVGSALASVVGKTAGCSSLIAVGWARWVQWARGEAVDSARWAAAGARWTARSRWDAAGVAAVHLISTAEAVPAARKMAETSAQAGLETSGNEHC